MPLRTGCARPHPPAGGGRGKPAFPTPLRTGCARPHPPAGGGLEKPGFPTPLRTGCALTFPRAGAWGNQVPPCSRQAPCAGRTTPDEHSPRARASRPRHGSAGTVTAPSLTLPRWGRKPGSSPQRGEAGRGLNAANDGHFGQRHLRNAVGGQAARVPSRPCGSAAQRRNKHTVLLGRAAPSPTLPGAGAWVRGPPARVR